MLKPSKHSHPDKTVINAALILLQKIKKNQVEELSELLKLTKKSVKGGSFLFMPALNLLYLLGLINYLPKTDSIEYIGPK